MRYLGAYPTERAMVKEILPDMMVRFFSSSIICAREDPRPQEDEPSAFVKYERFEPKMLEVLAEGWFTQAAIAH